MSKSDSQRAALAALQAEQADALAREDKAIAAMVAGLPGDARLVGTVQTIRNELEQLAEQIKIAEKAVTAADAYELSEAGIAQQAKGVQHLVTAEGSVLKAVQAAQAVQQILEGQLAPAVAKLAECHATFSNNMVGFYKTALAHDQNGRLNAIVSSSGLERTGADSILAMVDDALRPLSIGRGQLALQYQRTYGEQLDLAGEVRKALSGAAERMRGVGEREGLPL
ncbi:hypothetical protein [Limnohabitans sp. Bal53]|uniref:hypothetical protein n=1 Tax=Limnohabitans sp. Bal53 TaxID=1977910 RepID=UPI000D3834D5|nr:hypothetical protein [Limnohabitans sp. Bal53]PUE41425.1 hypothetical protein B9Z50_06875 [Limnohabitans sp. Bal53]